MLMIYLDYNATTPIDKPVAELAPNVIELMMKFGCRTLTELVDKAVESKAASLAQVNSLKDQEESLRPFRCIVKGLPEFEREIENKVLRLRSKQIRENYESQGVRRV